MLPPAASHSLQTIGQSKNICPQVQVVVVTLALQIEMLDYRTHHLKVLVATLLLHKIVVIEVLRQNGWEVEVPIVDNRRVCYRNLLQDEIEAGLAWELLQERMVCCKDREALGQGAR